MPESAIPAVVAVCAVFSLFILVVGGVSVWTSMPNEAAANPKKDIHEGA